MRTLSADLISRHAGAVQQPAWLVEIAFSSVLRLSSFDTVTVIGQTWTVADINVEGVRINGMSISGSLVFGNADDLFASYVLGEGVGGRAISIYGYDAAETDNEDVVHVIDCVGGEASVTAEKIIIALRDAKDFSYSPRKFINAANGFTQLIPAGKSIKINGQTYIIER